MYLNVSQDMKLLVPNHVVLFHYMLSERCYLGNTFVNNVISNCFHDISLYLIFLVFIIPYSASKVHGEQLWIRVITIQVLDLSFETFLAATSSAEC